MLLLNRASTLKHAQMAHCYLSLFIKTFDTCPLQKTIFVLFLTLVLYTWHTTSLSCIFDVLHEFRCSNY